MPTGASYWVAVFRVPADNYEHAHVCRVTSFGPSAERARQTLRDNTNPDVRIEKLYPLADQRQLLDETARVIREGGPGYRSLEGSEQFLTIHQARELREREGLSVSNLADPAPPATAEERAARAVGEARAEVMANPPELVVPGR